MMGSAPISEVTLSAEQIDAAADLAVAMIEAARDRMPATLPGVEGRQALAAAIVAMVRNFDRRAPGVAVSVRQTLATITLN